MTEDAGQAAFAARVARLQASELPQALQALLQQATGTLKPPTKSQARTPTPGKAPAAPADTRRVVVGGLVLLLERAGQLAPAEGDKLRKDASDRLLSAFRQQPWLWELLVRKHLVQLLAHPAATALLVGAVVRLEPGAQARACWLIRLQLQAAPLLASAPGALQLQTLLLGQLKQCFQVVSHELPGGEAGAADAAQSRVHVLLREQLPPLLHLLLVLASGSNSDGGGGSEGAPAPLPAQPAGSSGGASDDAGSANASNLHSLPTEQSAMDARPHGRQLEGKCDPGAAGGSGGAGVARGAHEAAACKCAATLVGKLSSADALHDMLGLELVGSQAVAAGRGDVGQAGAPQVEGEAATAAPAGISARDAARVHSAQELAEVLLEALLTLPAVAAAVHQQLHSSSGGNTEHEGCASSVAAGQQGEMGATVAAMLALHWELSKLLAAVGADSRRTRQSPWSVQCCLRLLQLAAATPKQGVSLAAGIRQDRLLALEMQRLGVSAAAGGEAARLLLPPAVLAHTLDLVRQSLMGQPVHAATAELSGWLEEAAERAAVLHAACAAGLSQPHAALQGSHQNAMSAAVRLHALLTTPAGEGTDSEAVAEPAGADGAAWNSTRSGRVAKRQRAQSGRDGAGPKRRKQERAEPATGSPVTELLQLLLPPQECGPPPAPPAAAQATPISSGRARWLTAELVQGGKAAGERKRIVAQPVVPANGATGGGSSSGEPGGSNASSAGEEEGEDEDVEVDGGAESEEEGSLQEHVVMSSMPGMTDEQREAMWAAYIEDKELMVEMLGDSDYQQWYDEDANPLARLQRPAMGLDAAFDAAFGSSSSAAPAPALPRGLLEISSLLPWQAASAAALQLLAHCLDAAAAGAGGGGAAAGPEPLPRLAARVVGEQQRAAAAAALLKVVKPDYFRKEWQLAVKGAGQAAVGGAMLYFSSCLLELTAARVVRLMAPALLAAHAQLLGCLLPAALHEQRTLLAATPGKRLLPLHLVAQTVQALLLVPPAPAQARGGLPPSALTPDAACCLLRVAEVHTPSGAWVAALLWALLAPGRCVRDGDRPAWVDAIRLEVDQFVLLKAGPDVKGAAVAELLALLSQQLQALQDQLAAAGAVPRLPGLLPAMNVCSLAARSVLEQQQQQRPQPQQEQQQQQQPQQQEQEPAPAEEPPPQCSSAAASAELLGAPAKRRLATLAAQLCSLCGMAAERLASLLDAAPTSCSSAASDSASGPKAAAREVPAAAELVAVSMELSDELSQLLAAGVLPQRQQQQLEAATEQLEGAQHACLELLRGLPEEDAGYAAAAAAMETAPSLWQPEEEQVAGPAPGLDRDAATSGEDEEEEEGGAQHMRQRKDDGGGSTRQRNRHGRQRRLRDVSNPYLRAILAESEGDGLDCEDLSDLEDFIVANPERDYSGFIRRHFPQARAWCHAEEEPEEPQGEGDQPEGAKGAARASKSKKKGDAKFCVVVRTYWGHGGSSSDGRGLRRLLRSLQRQHIQNWEAVLIVLDSSPFADLHSVVAEVNDTRVWVFAEWLRTPLRLKIGAQYQPKLATGTGEWSPGYHGHLYNLTDDAIQVCPPDTDWLVVTNGDNEYGQGFFQAVTDQGRPGAATDLVAFDFYSRFQRVTAPACVRFWAWDGSPACKRNRLRWCHTDLGANALNYQRFVRERRRYGALGTVAEGVTADHFDGIMAQELLRGGWHVRHLEDVCLFNHEPSFHSCAWRGGVWDDRDVVSWTVAGGRCISQEEADAVLAADPNAEEVAIIPSTDNRTQAFEGVGPGPHHVRCLRRKDYASAEVWGAAMDWYSMLCADDVDVNSFRAWEAMKAGGGQAQQQQQQWAPEVAATAQVGGAGGEAAAGAGTDYWALQREFYRQGVAYAPDPPPKSEPEQPVFRERFEGGETAAADQAQAQPGAEQAQAQLQQQQWEAEQQQQQQWGAEQQGAAWQEPEAHPQQQQQQQQQQTVAGQQQQVEAEQEPQPQGPISGPEDSGNFIVLGVS
eukprot:scaffold3.g6362.t1